MAIFGTLGERTLKGLVEVRREVTAERRHRCIAVALVILVERIRAEWQASGQCFVGDDAERIDSGCRAHGKGTPPLLGCHVCRELGPGIAVDESIEPEVKQL